MLETAKTGAMNSQRLIFWPSSFMLHRKAHSAKAHLLARIIKVRVQVLPRTGLNPLCFTTPVRSHFARGQFQGKHRGWRRWPTARIGVGSYVLETTGEAAGVEVFKIDGQGTLDDTRIHVSVETFNTSFRWKVGCINEKVRTVIYRGIKPH